MAKKTKYKPSPADVSADRRSIKDQFGRRIGHMWPEDFEANLKAIYGDQWSSKFARYAGLSRDIIYLYRIGRMPIPKHIAQLVRLLRFYSTRRPWKLTERLDELEPDWLPPME